MTITNNNDGSISITWVVPSITLSSSSSQSYFTSILPTPSNIAGSLKTVIVGTGATNTNIGTGIGTYDAYGIVHVQFGTDPNNTIKDYFQPLTKTFVLSDNSNPDSFVVQINVSGGPMTINIPSSALTDVRASLGIYAIGYIGVQGVPDIYTQVPVAGFITAVYDSATNSSLGTAAIPSAPTGFTVQLNSNNQTVATWYASVKGGAPIAYYNIRWGTHDGGPYPNVCTIPNTAGPQLTYTFPTEQFPFDGSTQFFVVQAVDNGSAPLTSTTSTTLGIVYNVPPPTVASITS